MITLPKVGFLSLSYSYAPLKTRELEEEILKELSKLPLEIVASQNTPGTPEMLLPDILELRNKDVDVIIVYFPNYFNEELMGVIAQEVTFCPLVLWGDCRSILEGSISASAIMIGASHLKHFGKDFFHVIGVPQERETASKVLAISKAAMAAKKLRRSTIAQVGGLNISMLVTGFNEYEMRKLVPNIIHLDPIELLLLFDEVNAKEATQVMKKITGKVGQVKVSEKDILAASKAYLTMKSLSQKYKLDAMTIRDWPDLAKTKEGFTMCIGSSLLNDEGVVTVQESDIPATITALALFYLNNKATYMGEIEGVIPGTEIVEFLHEGAVPFSLVKSPKDITLDYANVSVADFQGKKGGVSVQGAIKPGEVTISKLMGNTVAGELKMLITRATVVEPPRPVGEGFGSAFVKFYNPIESVVDRLVEEGFGHHLILTYGDVVAELQGLCKIWGVKKVLI